MRKLDPAIRREVEARLKRQGFKKRADGTWVRADGSTATLQIRDGKLLETVYNYSTNARSAAGPMRSR